MLYLLFIRQQFAELCELLCSVTIPSTLSDFLNYLLGRPVKSNIYTYFGVTSLLTCRKKKHDSPLPQREAVSA